MKDHPFSDWVNHQKDFEDGHPIAQSNHRRTTNQDSYASEFDKKGLADGWFIEQMPDLNQRNPFLALPNSKMELQPSSHRLLAKWQNK